MTVSSPKSAAEPKQFKFKAAKLKVSKPAPRVSVSKPSTRNRVERIQPDGIPQSSTALIAGVWCDESEASHASSQALAEEISASTAAEIVPTAVSVMSSTATMAELTHTADRLGECGGPEELEDFRDPADSIDRVAIDSFIRNPVSWYGLDESSSSESPQHACLMQGQWQPQTESAPGTTEIMSCGPLALAAPLEVPDGVCDGASYDETASIIDQTNQSPNVGDSGAIETPSMASMISWNSSLYSQKCTGLLDMYDSYFCTIPITSDMIENPFRCRAQTSRGSKHLLHAILAITMQCVGGINVDGSLALQSQDHRKLAEGLFKDATAKKTLARDPSMVDTALILFTLDAATSAVGNWSAHFSEAHTLIESCGGLQLLQKSRRIRSQIAMFLWWDCTVALVSRRSCVMPPEYFQSFLDFEENEWRFFDLNGLPKAFFRFLYELTTMAVEYERTLTMRWVRFDDTRVLEIEQEVINWKQERATFGGSMEDVESFQQELDKYHEVEAWRHTVLLFITRVFKWNRITSSPPALGCLSRLVLDHVRSCRRTTLVQKQLLLPVFLAGCESDDPYARDYAAEYCAWWAGKSQYLMFSDAKALLEEYWARRDASPSHIEEWWGSFIDSKHSPGNGAKDDGLSVLLG